MYSAIDARLDAYPIVEESDPESVESSDDDLDNVLRNGPNSRRQPTIRRRDHEVREFSSEDEFEKEMSLELNHTMKVIETRQKQQEDEGMEVVTSGNDGKALYDQEYFDSDSDEEGTREDKMKIKHPILSNDDLLYDPSLDDEDQKWVDKQRQKYFTQPDSLSTNVPPPGFNGKTKASQPAARKLPQSDAVLNCPACMSLLSLDCQRHDKYWHQYRAMFVSNCFVDTSEILRYDDSKSPLANQHGKKKNKKAKRGEMNVSAGEETVGDDDNVATDSSVERTSKGIKEVIYNPVRCSECNTEVGVYDKDEIYHFFNVLSSHA